MGLGPATEGEKPRQTKAHMSCLTRKALKGRV